MPMSWADHPPTVYGETGQIIRRAPVVCGAAAALLGLTILVAWALFLESVLWFLPGTAMQPMTAVMFVASGLALVAAARPEMPYYPRIVLALFVLTVSLLTLAQYVFASDIGFDRLLFPDAVAHQPIPARRNGRMAEITAILFGLIGTCLLLARTKSSQGRIAYVAASSIALVQIFGVFLGFLFSADPLQSIFGFFSVAILTAVGMATLILGLLAFRPDIGWVQLLMGDNVNAAVARRVLPIVLILPVAVTWLANYGVIRGLYHPDVRMVIITAVSATALGAGTLLSTSQLHKLAAIRRTEDELRDTRRQQAAILNNASVAIFAMDRTNRCYYMNPAAETMTGYTLEDLAGKTLHEVIHHSRPDGTPYPMDECPISFPEKAREAGEETFVRRDGSFYQVAYTASPFHDGDGNVVGTVLEALDIEDRKATEAQLRHIQRLDAVGQLTGGVAHDFNNILAVIVGNLDMAAERLRARNQELPDDLKDTESLELAAEALAAANRGAELVRRLLAFARRQQLTAAVVNINERLPAIADLLGRTLGETIEVRVDQSANLWPALIDAAQLDDAVLNLALNARDAMANGGVLTINTANVSLDQDYVDHAMDLNPGDYVLLAVSDNGAGMTPDAVARAFEPFFTTKEEGKGTGLGLSQVYGWAKQSGGHASIYSAPGLGTTVKIYLPRAQGLKSAPEIDDSGHAVAGGEETILVVEDNADVRRTVVRMLGELGYSTIEAGSGPEALDILKKGTQCDLMLSDIVMPGGLTGIDLTREVRGIRPDLRVVLTSGYLDLGKPTQHRQVNTPLLSKPYKKQELARVIRSALEAG